MRLIDADVLIKAIHKKQAEPDYQHVGEDWEIGLSIADGLVWEQPTIELKHKNGKWMEGKHPYDDDGTYYCFCSECGSDAHEQSEFCPHCGADMRGEQNEID